MSWKKARELFTGEMFTLDMDQFMFHNYYQIVGHKHEEKLVVCKRIGQTDWLGNYTTTVHYDQYVRTRPDAPRHIRSELRTEWAAYKEWPYDLDGNFSFAPWDWTQEPPVQKIKGE